MKKTVAVLLSILLLLPLCAGFASPAAAADTGTFTAFCYNVAGLPSLSFLTGGESVNVINNQVCIGKYVSEKQYDIFATQEDFGYHDNLVGALQGYEYQTFHHGGVPYGDGTNVFTRSFPMYNEAHIVWDQLYGVADDGADEFSQKGITYVCLKLAEDVYIDFYDIHADAYGDPGSLAARQDNFRQLAELINARTVDRPVIVTGDFYDIHADAYGDPGSLAARQDNFRQLAELINNRTVDRPVIVTGDFNAYLFYDASLLKETLVDGAGLKDAWVEVKNGGNYTDCSYYLETYGTGWEGKWGVWDSVERFMYKDGGGISLACTSFEYVEVLNSKGQPCSDHKAAEASFTYTVNSASENIGSETAVTSNSGFMEIVRRIVTFFRKLIFGIQNFDKVREYLGF